MVSIKLVNVSNYALNNVSLNISSRSIHVVVGPNGAGKTTLLKVIAGLVDYSGNVLFDNEPVDHLPPWERHVGYLPQTTALFPHMTVLENVLFGLRARGIKGSKALSTAKYYLELLGIYELRNRYPLTLSGGEQKKVALARALAINPRVLLLDEPFTGIHYDYRIQLRDLIRRIHRCEDLTIIIVTHDLDEAIELGSHYSILINGQLRHSGNLGGFLETIKENLHYVNAYYCVVTDIDYDTGLAKVNCNDVVLTVPLSEKPVKVGDEVLVTIPSDRAVLYISGECYPRVNCLSGKIVEVERWSNSSSLVKVSLNGVYVNVVTSACVGVGNEVRVKLPIKYLRVYSLQ